MPEKKRVEAELLVLQAVKIIVNRHLIADNTDSRIIRPNDETVFVYIAKLAEKVKSQMEVRKFDLKEPIFIISS